MANKKGQETQELPPLQGGDKSFHDALGIPEGDTEVHQELLTAAQQTFEQIIKVDMLGDKQDWEFDHFEFERIKPLVNDHILYGLLDHFFSFAPPWETIEDWRDWSDIRGAIILRLRELDLFNKLQIHLQGVPPSINGKPIVQ